MKEVAYIYVKDCKMHCKYCIIECKHFQCNIDNAVLQCNTIFRMPCNED